VEERIVNLVNLRRRLRRLPTEQLATPIDDAARVRCVIRRVEQAQSMKVVAMPHLQKLVVGSTRNDFDFELRKSLVVDDSAQRARRKNISSGTVNLIRSNRD